MALTDGDGNGMVMPVSPMYGGGYGGSGFGFGGDWGWIVLLLLLAGNGGWGFGGMGGGMNYDFPWILNGQNGINNNVSSGFRDAQLSDGITSIRDGISGLSTQLCNCCGDMQMAVAGGFANAETAANARQMANMNQAFAAQTAMAQGFSDNRFGIADLKYTIATEECATRSNSTMNSRDIIDAQTRGTQAILDKLCALELDGVKAQLAQAEREKVGLQNQLNMAVVQNGMNAEVDALYNRLKNCPVPTTPVYGTTPIFTCNGNGGCGCGNNF